MALTKISTGGVKDDTADEAKLKVSNAGTNGQFLQKQSGNTGGLTWSDVTIPDADKCIEGNTSVEAVDTGSNGNVRITTEGTERIRIDETGKTHIGSGTSNFGDAKVNIATGGEDGISMAPADLGNPTSGAVLGSYAFNGALNNQTTLSAEAKITAIAAENMSGTSAATDLAFYTKPTGTGPGSAPSERIRIGSLGQLGIGGATYGSSGQVLTSGGASAAPSWTTISAAPEITATANGAIAANKPVIVESDGKIAEVFQVSAGTGSVTEFHTAGSSRPQYPKLAYDTTNNKVLCVYENLNESGNPYAVAGVVSSGSVSWGTPVALSTNFNVGGAYATGVEFDASIGQFIAYAFGSSNQGNLYRIWITSTDTVNSTAYAMSDASMRQNVYNSLCLEGNGNGTYFFSDAGDGYKMKGVHLSYTSSSLSQGSKEEISPSATGARMSQVVFTYIPGQDKYLAAGKQDGNNNQWFHLISRSSSTYSIAHRHLYDSTANGSVGNQGHQDIVGAGDDFVFAYKNESGHLVVEAGTVSGNNITALLNSAVQLESSISDDVAIEYYAAANRYYVNFNKSSTIYRVVVKATSAGTSAPTIASSPVSISADIGHGMGLTYDPDSAKMIHAWGSTDDNDGKSVMRTEESTNITSENFIGFATAAISDTASGTVAVTGNTTTQSSLTPGKRYYVTNTGGLSTTAAEPSVEAGVALTSTQLLIR